MGPRPTKLSVAVNKPDGAPNSHYPGDRFTPRPPLNQHSSGCDVNYVLKTVGLQSSARNPDPYFLFLGNPLRREAFCVCFPLEKQLLSAGQ